MSRKFLQLEKEISSREELEKLTLGSLKRAVVEGDVKNGSVMLGQISGMIKEEKILKEIYPNVKISQDGQSCVLVFEEET